MQRHRLARRVDDVLEGIRAWLSGLELHHRHNLDAVEEVCSSRLYLGGQAQLERLLEITERVPRCIPNDIPDSMLVIGAQLISGSEKANSDEDLNWCRKRRHPPRVNPGTDDGREVVMNLCVSARDDPVDVQLAGELPELVTCSRCAANAFCTLSSMVAPCGATVTL